MPTRLILPLFALFTFALSGCDAVRAAPPEQILRGLNTDPAVLACFEGAHGQGVEMPADAFESRSVDLNADGKNDLIVTARHPCLTGDSGLQWAYLRVDQSWRLAGRAGTHPAKAFVGKWLPKSAVYYAFEPLVIGRATLDAGSCKNQGFELQPAANGAQLLLLRGERECRLNGDSLRVLRLEKGATACELVVTIFPNAAAARNETLVSRGVFSRAQDCL